MGSLSSVVDADSGYPVSGVAATIAALGSGRNRLLTDRIAPMLGR